MHLREVVHRHETKHPDRFHNKKSPVPHSTNLFVPSLSWQTIVVHQKVVIAKKRRRVPHHSKKRSLVPPRWAKSQISGQRRSATCRNASCSQPFLLFIKICPEPVLAYNCHLSKGWSGCVQQKTRFAPHLGACVQRHYRAAALQRSQRGHAGRVLLAAIRTEHLCNRPHQQLLLAKQKQSLF